MLQGMYRLPVLVGMSVQHPRLAPSSLGTAKQVAGWSTRGAAAVKEAADAYMVQGIGMMQHCAR